MSFSITNTNKSTRKGSAFSKTVLSKLVGSTSIVVPSNLGLGAYPTAISFPNTTGNYALVETPNASPIGNNLFIEAWVYFGSIGSTAQTIFSMGDANNEYISIKVADQGGPEIAGPFTCSLQTTSGTTTVSSTINKAYSLNNLYYPPGLWLSLYLPQPAQYFGSFQIVIYIRKLAGSPAMTYSSDPASGVYIAADFEFDMDGLGNFASFATNSSILPPATTWPAGVYNTTYTWVFPGLPPPVSCDRTNPTNQRQYRFRLRGGGTINGTFYDIVDLLESNLVVISGTFNDFRAQQSQWNHLAFSYRDDNKTLTSFCNGMWVNTVAGITGTPLFNSLSTIGASRAGTQTPFNGYIRDLRIIQGGYPPEGNAYNLMWNPNFGPDDIFGVGNTPSYAGATNVFDLFPFKTYTPSKVLALVPKVTGGNSVQISGNYKIVSFTTVGTQNLIVSGTSLIAEVLIVAGGGGGGCGGGGAGGLVYYSSTTLTTGTYTVTVGAGGNGAQYGGPTRYNGGNSSITGLTVAIGGGGGGTATTPYTAGVNGGSGGGGGADSVNITGGTGTSGQGYNGGSGGNWSGGGGGAGGIGGNGGLVGVATGPGAGGPGLQYSISGTPTYYAAGGGAGGAAGGTGGGGQGYSSAPGGDATSYGSGGGGSVNGTYGGKGYQGIVIIKYRNSPP